MIETDKFELNGRSIQFVARCPDLSYIYKTATQICLNTIFSIGIGSFHDFTFLAEGKGWISACSKYTPRQMSGEEEVVTNIKARKTMINKWHNLNIGSRNSSILN